MWVQSVREQERETSARGATLPKKKKKKKKKNKKKKKSSRSGSPPAGRDLTVIKGGPIITGGLVGSIKGTRSQATKQKWSDGK